MKILNYKSAIAAWCGLLFFGVAVFGDKDFLTEDDLFALEDDEGMEPIYDPLEPLNRIIFEFNDFVYLNLLDPVARGYQKVTPDPVERGASNFFRNLRYPIRLAGNLLQGRLNGAWVETGRFAINTTVGVGGIFTPADAIEVFQPIPAENVGNALGAWGIGEGPYLVLPLLGPSNVRDFFGIIGDRAAYPLREPFSVISDWNWEWRLALGATEVIVESPALLARYQQMKGGAIDPYGSLKNGYTQFRRAAIEE